jgi:hypothetical protein
VLDHLTDEQKPAVTKRLNAAYALEDYAAAKPALNAFHREMMDLNPSIGFMFRCNCARPWAAPR